MEVFCDTIRASLDILAQGLTRRSVRLVECDTATCTIQVDHVRVRIYCDERNGYVGSTMTFQDPRFQEELDTHVLARIFGNRDKSFERNANVRARVEMELTEISNLLRAVEERNITHGEMYYFFLGYSEGYTKALSM